MKIMNKSSVAIVSILFASIFAGCELIPTSDENEAAVGVIDASNAQVVSIEDTTKTLKDGFFNLGEIDSASYSIKSNGTMSGKDIEGKDGSIDFDITISGESDGKDKVKPKFTLNFDGSGDIQSEDINESIAAAFELRMNEAFAYATLTKLTGLENSEDIPVETLALINANLGKWWKVELPEGAFDGIEAIAPKADESEMSEFEKEMKALAENTNFFTEVKLAGNSNDTNVYDLTLDIEATKAYLVEAAKLEMNNNYMGDYSQDMDLQADQDVEIERLKTELDKQFEALEIRSLQVSYNTEFNVISGLAVSLKVISADELEFDGEFSIGLANFNESVTIAEPADAQLFDPAALFGFGGEQENIDFDMDMDVDMDINMDDMDIEL